MTSLPERLLQGHDPLVIQPADLFLEITLRPTHRNEEGQAHHQRPHLRGRAHFAPNLQAMGLMTTRDFENYLSLFELMEEFVTPPDLMVYLRASVPTLVAKFKSAVANTKRPSVWFQSIERTLRSLDQHLQQSFDRDVDNNFHESKEDLGASPPLMASSTPVQLSLKVVQQKARYTAGFFML